MKMNLKIQGEKRRRKGRKEETFEMDEGLRTEIRGLKGIDIYLPGSDENPSTFQSGESQTLELEEVDIYPSIDASQANSKVGNQPMNKELDSETHMIDDSTDFGLTDEATNENPQGFKLVDHHLNLQKSWLRPSEVQPGNILHDVLSSGYASGDEKEELENSGNLVHSGSAPRFPTPPTQLKKKLKRIRIEESDIENDDVETSHPGEVSTNPVTHVSLNQHQKANSGNKKGEKEKGKEATKSPSGIEKHLPPRR